MSGRTSLQLKKQILSALNDKKSLTYAQLEKKVNTNWETIRLHCKELEIFKCIKIEKKTGHIRNNKFYYEIKITKKGLEVLKKL